MAKSISEIEKILDRIGLSMEESDKRRADMERVLAESRAETERVLAESRTETERAMKELAEAQQITEHSITRMSEKVDRVTGNVGGLNRSIGEIVQIIVIPGIISKMNALGHDFTMASIEKEYYKVEGRNLLEVDLLLENCQEVMAIEVKTSVTVNKIEHHLGRLKLLRKNEKNTGMAGKTMYAAIGGLRFTDDARQFARECGMYLIDIDEDDEKIDVVSPETVGKW
ncbi:MAG: hypothetical protein FWC23_05945 [Chitinispirillia bacterium]|nr:hypothetical protein [Chitinispirillia bacterium]MCL2268709.1 hypothetical protein [Chitinispirillia bacterium]